MHFVPLHSVIRSLAFHCFLGGGGSCRRQGKSAAPSGRRGERVGRDRRVSPVSLKHSEKRDRRGRGLDKPRRPSPRPPGPPRSRGMAKMGGPGAGGLWRGFVVCLPSSRSATRADGRYNGFQGGEPDFWPHSDYRWVYRGFLTCTRTAGTRDSRGRTCSKRPTLSCVPEGAPFFAAAAPAGARAPLKTIERYAFLKVRRAGAPVPGARKSLIFH